MPKHWFFKFKLINVKSEKRLKILWGIGFFIFASVTIMNLINQLMSYLQAIAAAFYGYDIKLERHNSIASATWSYCLTLSFILWEKIKLCLGRQTFLAAFFVHILLFFQRCYFCFLYLLWSFRFLRWVKSTENFLFDVFL